MRLVRFTSNSYGDDRSVFINPLYVCSVIPSDIQAGRNVTRINFGDNACVYVFGDACEVVEKLLEAANSDCISAIHRHFDKP